MRSLALSLAVAVPLALAAPAAATTTLSVRDGALHIDGDDGRNSIHLDTGGSPGVAVSDNAPGSSVVRGQGCGENGCAAYDRIVIDLKGGDDSHSDNGFVPPLTIFGGDGNDRAWTGAGRVRFDGGAGNDWIAAIGYDHYAVFRGGPGDDRLETGARSAILDGGADDDHLIGGRWLYGRGGRGLLEAVFGARLFGGPGGDTIVTGQLDDRVLAGPGRDWIDVGAGGRDRVDCGPGRDRVLRARRSTRLRRC